MKADTILLLLSDARPLISPLYADVLDVLFKPEWPMQIVEMVLHEVI